MLHHRGFHCVHISSVEGSHDPPTFLSNFGTYSVDMVCEAESNAHFYGEIFNTLGLLNCCFIWAVV